MLESFTPAKLKTQFYRILKYITPFDNTATYAANDIVEYENNKYQATSQYTSPALPTDNTAWTLLTREAEDVFLADINNAANEASFVFHTAYFKDKKEDEQLFAFNYLVMHFLSYDLNINSLTEQSSVGIVSSVSVGGVGSVSESFTIPEWVSKDPSMSMLASTPFGKKYIQLLLPGYARNRIIVDRTQDTIIN